MEAHSCWMKWKWIQQKWKEDSENENGDLKQLILKELTCLPGFKNFESMSGVRTKDGQMQMNRIGQLAK